MITVLFLMINGYLVYRVYVFMESTESSLEYLRQKTNRIYQDMIIQNERK